MFLKAKKPSRLIAIMIVIAMVFTGFVVPGIEGINVYATESYSDVPVTKVIISGELKVGETVTAVATGENDEPANNITYKWQYEDQTYDDWTEEFTTQYIDIDGEVNKTLKISNNLKGKKIRVVVNSVNGTEIISNVSAEIQADTSEDMQILEELLKFLRYGTLNPEYGKHTNIVLLLEDKIKEKGRRNYNEKNVSNRK